MLAAVADGLAHPAHEVPVKGGGGGAGGGQRLISDVPKNHEEWDLSTVDELNAC